MSKVSIRHAAPEDGRFVADSWLRSFKGSYHVKRVPPEVYWKQHRAVVASLVDRSDVLVACDPLDPWTVWGWACAERQGSALVVHYVYVKNAFRGLRVGSSLIRALVDEAPTTHVWYTHDTRGAKHFIDGLRAEEALPPGVGPVYNPYQMHQR